MSYARFRYVDSNKPINLFIHIPFSFYPLAAKAKIIRKTNKFPFVRLGYQKVE